MSMIDLLDVIWLTAVIIFTAVTLNILRKFLLSDNLEELEKQTPKVDRWTQNSRNLYQSLKIFAYCLTILIVSLGVLTALDIFNYSEDGLSLPLLYMIAVAAGEASKLWTVQAFARHPSLPIFLTALIALFISIFFASESLFNISSQVQKHSNYKIDNFLTEKASNTALIEGYEIQILELEERESRKIINTTKTEEFLRLESSLEDVRIEREKLFNDKEEILEANNKNSKAALKSEIGILRDFKKTTQQKIELEQDYFSQELQNLNQSRAEAVASAGFSRRRSVDIFYQQRINDLESNSRAKINKFEDDINGYKKKIEDKTSKAESFNKLSPGTKESLKKLNRQIAEGENAEERILAQLNKLSIDKDLEINILRNNIGELQNLKNSLLEQQINLAKNISKLKNDNFLYVLASSFYGKPPLEVTPEEQMSFSFYFVGLGAVFLALLPSLLAVLSVMLEKRVELPTSKKLSIMELVLDSLKTLNLTIKKSFQELSSQKDYQNRLKLKFETRTKNEIDRNQKKLQRIEESFKTELSSKEGKIAELEKDIALKNFEVKHIESHNEPTPCYNKDFEEMKKTLKQILQLNEAQESHKNISSEQRNHELLKSFEQRLMMQELFKLVEEEKDDKD